MQETVLITGGSGLVGTRLTQYLIEKGYRVNHISRKCNPEETALCFIWDLATGYWDKEAIEGVSYIIHLAGANVAEGRWTTKRKQQILESRVKSSQMVSEMVKASNGSIKSVISASAVGYYGISMGDSLVDETLEAGNDFLANVCKQWENAISVCDTNVAILRLGVVLSNNGGAISKMVAPIKWGVGSPLGLGSQLMPWIHIDDLCTMFLFAIEKKWQGAYNAVAPQIVSNKEFTYQLASAVNRKIIVPNVPSFALRLMLGDMSEMLLTGVNVSTTKTEKARFQFDFPSLSMALNDLLD